MRRVTLLSLSPYHKINCENPTPIQAIQITRIGLRVFEHQSKPGTWKQTFEVGSIILLYGLRISEMKNGIVWPSAIGEMKKGENAHLQRSPKPGSDSSVQSIVWPSANGGSDERKKMPDFSGIRRLVLIQAFGPSCGLRPLADRMKTNIYAVVFDVRSGQEISAKIGLRLGE